MMFTPRCSNSPLMKEVIVAKGLEGRHYWTCSNRLSSVLLPFNSFNVILTSLTTASAFKSSTYYTNCQLHTSTSTFSIIGNKVANKAHSHHSSTGIPTNQTDNVIILQKDCNLHRERHLTDSLQHTTLGCIRQDTQHHWWTNSPSCLLDTAVTRLKIGLSYLNAHMHKLGLMDIPHCLWCPTQPDTPRHLLLHYPCHHSHHTALPHSLASLHIHSNGGELLYTGPERWREVQITPFTNYYGTRDLWAWHLIRHGTRYPGKDDIARFVLELPGMQTSILKAHHKGQGELCEGDLSLLSGWSLGTLNTFWASILAPEGELELEGLASRYKAALPSLFGQQFSNDSFKVSIFNTSNIDIEDLLLIFIVFILTVI
ncbi:hypothetical protein E2C01_028769 [Portunus trituberculatus]|uniref:Uncharacterized protein n=1 Tax=Portunus trituberculatus TaxID=210409 RepID=A0A5B7EPZ3_PORTR|nr:hypothetical protein [Portunus trituberculatus]